MKNSGVPIIVVEGKSDVQFLSTFLNAEFVITNGSALSIDTINYLKEQVKDRKVIVLTDPDYPGKKIRDELDNNIPNLYHAYIKKENAVKNNKVGVAESNKEEVLNALKNLDLSYEVNINKFDTYFLIENGLSGSEKSHNKRKYLSDILSLGECNAKTLLKRLNRSRYNKEDILKILEGYHD